MKYFIITVDTEGDDLWHYTRGETVTTEKTRFIHNFQELCEKYCFKPVYLTNYEMVKDYRFVDYIKPKMCAGLCEVGLHVHAWNNPPLYELKGEYNGNPYLIEYPEKIMREKLVLTANLIKEMFGIWPVSHRAGRWAMNESYFRILSEIGIKVDCSYTPHVNWNKSTGTTIPAGPDYRKVYEGLQIIEGVLEVPMSIRKATYYKFFQQVQKLQVKSSLRTLKNGYVIWGRPSVCSIEEMKHLTLSISKERHMPYLEMMIHSSELMPGGSPYFKDTQAIEGLYQQLKVYFDLVSSLGYQGTTLKNFAETINLCD